MNFRWNKSDLISVNGKNVDAIMDSEDSNVIYSECEILELVMDYFEENELSCPELIEQIKGKIENDALDLACDWLL